jgi:hypothetical protein
VDMTRIRLEGLLAAFPKLLGNDAKQHTYVETEVSTFVTVKHVVNDVTIHVVVIECSIRVSVPGDPVSRADHKSCQ